MKKTSLKYNKNNVMSDFLKNKLLITILWIDIYVERNVSYIIP